MSCTSHLLLKELPRSSVGGLVLGKDQSPFGGGSGGHCTFLLPCFAAMLAPRC